MRILIVDDESLNRELLLHMLEQEGYCECIEASNGAEAIALAEKVQPDLVLLDVMMPEMTGYEAAPILKAQAQGRYLPVVFITSLDDKASLLKCLEVGGDDFAIKPFDKHILAAKIRAHARIRSLSKHIDEQNQELRYYKQGVMREHRIVEHIFNNAIVNPENVLAYFDYHITPSTHFNGDVFLCEASPKGGLYFMVGDFTGQGLASAVGALPVTRTFQQMTARGLSVQEIATELNSLLLRFLPKDMCFAAIIGEVSGEGGRFTVWNGGMPQVLLKSNSLDYVRTYPSRHMALGVLAEDEFDSQCDNFSANAGDQLMLYTDGLIEISNGDGKMLDEAQLRRWVAEPGAICADKIYRQARTFSGENSLKDDLTLVVFNCQSLSELLPRTEEVTLPFTLSTTLQVEHIRQSNPLQALLDMISSQSVLNRVRANLFTVLAEMFNNALEHGLLKIDASLKNTPEGFMAYYEQREAALASLNEGVIDVTVRYESENATVCVTVCDSGSGFDVSQIKWPSQNNPLGRGLALLNDIASHVWHEKDGRQVSVRLPV